MTKGAKIDAEKAADLMVLEAAGERWQRRHYPEAFTPRDDVPFDPPYWGEHGGSSSAAAASSR